MGKHSPTDIDQVDAIASGTFDSAARGTSLCSPKGDFNVTISFGTGASATVVPVRSFDGGTTWVPFCYSDGSPVSWTRTMTTVLSEMEDGVRWTLSVLPADGGSRAAGEITWRISQ